MFRCNFNKTLLQPLKLNAEAMWYILSPQYNKALHLTGQYAVSLRCTAYCPSNELNRYTRIAMGRNLKFGFGEPEHGWLVFKISDLENEVIFDASDVPNNFLETLAIALNRLRDGSLQEEVEFSLEPNFALCRFLLNENKINIEVYPTSARDNPVKFMDSKEKVLHSLYKSLRDLEALECWKRPDCSARIWSWGFPHRELDVYKSKSV